jgi:CDP-diacylglycerol--glycerol-3-phosphate 3-phosphatidyltransferase
VLSVRVIMVPLFLVIPNRLSDHSLLWLYLVAFVTDYFDGVIARRLGTAIPLLRKTDSTADTFFHLALVWAILQHHPAVFNESKAALAAFLVTAVSWYALDAFRWCRVAGFHAYSAKFFSTCLLIWIVLLLSGVRAGALLQGVLIVGTLSNLECIGISLLLRTDRSDVATVLHARFPAGRSTGTPGRG